MDNMALKNEILSALDNDTKVDASHIGIIVENGIVTLTGRVHSLADSAYAIGVTKMISGVKAIAQEITVIEKNAEEISDETISENIIEFLERDTMIPENNIQVSVRNGCVTATGHVEWLYQKNAVEQVLRGVEGVTDYTNQINIEEPINDDEMEAKIANRIANAENLNSDGLNIVAHSGVVVLSGIIENRNVHDKIVKIVKNISGVDKTIDHLTYVEF